MAIHSQLKIPETPLKSKKNTLAPLSAKKTPVHKARYSLFSAFSRWFVFVAALLISGLSFSQTEPAAPEIRYEQAFTDYYKENLRYVRQHLFSPPGVPQDTPEKIAENASIVTAPLFESSLAKQLPDEETKEKIRATVRQAMVQRIQNIHSLPRAARGKMETEWNQYFADWSDLAKREYELIEKLKKEPDGSKRKVLFDTLFEQLSLESVCHKVAYYEYNGSLKDAKRETDRYKNEIYAEISKMISSNQAPEPSASKEMKTDISDSVKPDPEEHDLRFISPEVRQAVEEIKRKNEAKNWYKEAYSSYSHALPPNASDHEKRVLASQISIKLIGIENRNGSIWNNGTPFPSGAVYLERMLDLLKNASSENTSPPMDKWLSPGLDKEKHLATVPRFSPKTHYLLERKPDKYFIFGFVILLGLGGVAICSLFFPSSHSKANPTGDIKNATSRSGKSGFYSVPSFSEQQVTFHSMGFPEWCQWAVSCVMTCEAAIEKTPECENFFDKARLVYSDLQKTIHDRSFRLGVFLNYWQERLKDRDCPESVRSYANERDLDDTIAPLLPGFTDAVEHSDLAILTGCLIYSTNLKNTFRSFYTQLQTGSATPVLGRGVQIVSAFLTCFAVFLSLMPIVFVSVAFPWGKPGDLPVSIIGGFVIPLFFAVICLPFVVAFLPQKIMGACLVVKVASWVILGLSSCAVFLTKVWLISMGVAFFQLSFRLLTIWIGVRMVFRLGSLLKGNSDKNREDNRLKKTVLYVFRVLLVSTGVWFLALLGYLISNYF